MLYINIDTVEDSLNQLVGTMRPVLQQSSRSGTAARVCRNYSGADLNTELIEVIPLV